MALFPISQNQSHLNSAFPNAVIFVFPGPIETISGGYIYDRSLLQGLEARGLAVSRVVLDANFPFPDQAGIARSVAQILEAYHELLQAGISRGTGHRNTGRPCILMDGLAACAAPDLVCKVKAESAQASLVGVLVHHPLCDETGISQDACQHFFKTEQAALQAADFILVTSQYTRKRLTDLFELEQKHISVAEPGTPQHPVGRLWQNLATAARPPLKLLNIGALIPRKGQHILIAALDLFQAQYVENHGNQVPDWQLTIVGPLDRDPVYYHHVKEAARSLGDRIKFTGELAPAALETIYDTHHLFISTALYEGFGMALAEAAARGMPMIAVDGGAISTTHAGKAACLIEPGDEGGRIRCLAELLYQFYTKDSFREKLAMRSEEARSALTDWSRTAESVCQTLTFIQKSGVV